MAGRVRRGRAARAARNMSFPLLDGMRPPIATIGGQDSACESGSRIRRLHDVETAMAIDASQRDHERVEAGTGADAADEARSQFERIRAFLTGQFGVIRQVEAGQQSAERLLELAEGELGDLKRAFAAARLDAPKR